MVLGIEILCGARKWTYSHSHPCGFLLYSKRYE